MNCHYYKPWPQAKITKGGPAMKQPTKGEQIVFAEEIAAGNDVPTLRRFLTISASQAAAIDAAIAEAVNGEREACAVVAHEFCAECGEDIAAAIRARGNLPDTQ